VTDGRGGFATAEVSVTVGAVNDAPVAVNDTYATDEDQPLSISAAAMLQNDVDVEGDPLTVQIATQPANGSLVPG